MKTGEEEKKDPEIKQNDKQKKSGKNNTLLLVLILVFGVALIGYVVFDFILNAPNVSMDYDKAPIGQQKLDTEFKVKVNVESLAFIGREYRVNLDLIGPDGKATPINGQVVTLLPKTPQMVAFNCVLSQPCIPGNYTANAYVTASKSILFPGLDKIAEKKQPFLIAEKIVNGVLNIIDIKGSMKVGDILTVNAVVKNTGEVAKDFSVDGYLLNTKNEKADLPPKDFSIKVEESKKFSYSYNLPLEAPAGTYKLHLNLYAGMSTDTSKRKINELENDVPISERVIKASVESIVKGILKSGENIDIDVDVKNIGDIGQMFSFETSLADPSEKSIPLPAKEMFIPVNSDKKITYSYSIPMKDSSGKYKVNIIVNAGASNDAKKVKIAESQQEFTVAERITKASIVKVALNAKSKVKVGSTITVVSDVKNIGETEHTFPVSVVVNTPKDPIKTNAKTISLKVGEVNQVSIDVLIPLEYPDGDYEVRSSVWNDMDSVGNLVEMYDEKAVKVAVAGADVSGSANIVSISVDNKKAEYGFGDAVPLKVQFKNTGEIKHSFFIKIEVTDSDNKVSTVLNEKADIDKNGAVLKEAEYKVDPEAKDGKYSVSSSIWEKLGDDGNPVNQYNKDTKTFNVVDYPPTIPNIIGVAPVIQQATTIRCTVKDDKEVKFVVLVYQGPGMDEQEKEIMTRVSGNKKEGDYTADTRRFIDYGSLIYHIEATDSKGQVTKSPETTTQIK